MKKGRTVLQAKRYGIHSCSPSTSLISAIRTMVEDEVSSLVVEDDQGYLAGLITRFHILRAHISLENWASQCVREHMKQDVPVVFPDTLLIDAARLMLEEGGRQIVVVLNENGKLRPVAMLTDADLAYHIVKAS